MWNIRALHRKGLAERKEKERVLSSERAHKVYKDKAFSQELRLLACS